MLTPLQTQKLTHYFNVLDFNKNGVITLGDFKAIGENLSILWGFREGTEAYQTCVSRCEKSWYEFKKFSGRNSEVAHLEEWLAFADAYLASGPEEIYDMYVRKIVDEIFNYFDTNHDNYISLDEYIDLFMAYRIEIRFSARSFTKLDLNHDDLLSRDEIQSAVYEFFRGDDPQAPGNWLFGFWELGSGK